MNPILKNLSSFIRAHFFFFFLLLLYTGYAFYLASSLELQSWDESRNVQNAYEMQKNNDWIGITFQEKLDDWNLKPPFATWLIALSIKMFGFSELAVRLPGLLFGLGILIIVYSFMYSLTRDKLLSTITVFGLALSIAFFGQHCLTNADYDVFLMFFNTISFIAIYKIVLEEKYKWYCVLGCSLGLAYMTKSLTGLIPLLFFAQGFLITRRVVFLKRKYILFCTFLFLLITVPFLTARELLYDDDYLSLQFNTDIYNRITGAVENHAGGWNYYFKNMEYIFREWMYLFLATGIWFMLSSVSRKNKFTRQQLLFIGISALLYLLLFSIPRTKISWYILPAYPLMVIFSGLMIYNFLWEKISKQILILFFIGILSLQLKNLVLHNRQWLNRDYEFMTKRLILPHVSLIKENTIVSIDTLMPSSFTYLEILSNGKHLNYTDIVQGNQYILKNRKDIKMVITRDSALIFPELKNSIQQIASENKYALYRISPLQ